MKFLVVLLVVAVAIGWVLMRIRRHQGPPVEAPAAEKELAEMLACARCGMHLPRPEVVIDDAGRAFCSPEHRDAGPA